ncbi:hypothetical protein HPB47_000159 [Ixodes persulcatus]|uniref:Uncharacterized protein n=1 Tax=Ixodes persulcatus TaxID=34615 RepID=A0AC60PT68_IXOPE|nr:hypothetical protein HPB47_000159 [Ixodes persulcatus]
MGPKGSNLPRARLNHQDVLFPGHGKATHNQTWAGEPAWLGGLQDVEDVVNEAINFPPFAHNFLDHAKGFKGAPHRVHRDVESDPVELDAKLSLTRVNDETKPAFNFQVTGFPKLGLVFRRAQLERPDVAHLESTQTSHARQNAHLVQRPSAILDLIRSTFAEPLDRKAAVSFNFASGPGSIRWTKMSKFIDVSLQLLLAVLEPSWPLPTGDGNIIVGGNVTTRKSMDHTTGVFPNPATMTHIHPSLYPTSACPLCGAHANLAHIIWACPRDPFPEIPSEERWEASLRSPDPDLQARLVKRAEEVAGKPRPTATTGPPT